SSDPPAPAPNAHASSVAIGPAQVRLDLGDRKPNIILLELDADRFAHLSRIRLPDDAQRARRSHHDEAVDLAGGNRRIEASCQALQEISLRLLMPVGLLHRAARRVHGLKARPGTSVPCSWVDACFSS